LPSRRANWLKAGHDQGCKHDHAGALVKASNIVSFDFLQKHLAEVLGEGKSKLIKVNKEALQVGFDYVKE
jgi:hypothetical protein